MSGWTNDELAQHVDREEQLEQRWASLLDTATVRLGGRVRTNRFGRGAIGLGRLPVIGSWLDGAVRRILPSTVSDDDVNSDDPDELVAGSEFLYRPGELLVDSPKGVLVVQGREPTATDSGPVGGFWRVTWSASGLDPLVMRTIVRGAMPGTAVEVNHVLTFEPRYSFKPDGPPFPTAEGTSGRGGGKDEPVNVVVVDTGLPSYAQEKHDVLKARATAVPDPLWDDGVVLHDVGGHGTFIAARILERSERARVVSRSCAHRDGFTDEWTVAVELAAALADDAPAVVNLSVGGYTSGDAGLPVLGRLVPKTGWPVVVGAAGNEGTTRPFFPAAFDHVVGVAAVDAKIQRGRFSNHGPWVDGCADGVGAVAPFVDGWVRWSGTSFAAPVVAAALADRYDGGDSVVEAVNDVLAASGTSVESCGSLVK